MQGILETERLFLRKMTMEDFDSLYVVLADSGMRGCDYCGSSGRTLYQNSRKKGLTRP